MSRVFLQTLLALVLTALLTPHRVSAEIDLSLCQGALNAAYTCVAGDPEADCCTVGKYILSKCSDGGSYSRLFDKWDAFTNDFLPSSVAFTEAVQTLISTCPPVSHTSK